MCQLEYRRQSVAHTNARWYVVHHADADRRPVVHDSAGRCHGNAISDTGAADGASRHPRRGIDAIRADSDAHSTANANGTANGDRNGNRDFTVAETEGIFADYSEAS